MLKRGKYTEMERLRSYSSIFSRKVFSGIMEYGDFTRLDTLLARYDFPQKNVLTYLDYIRYVYRVLAKHYRCEYVYKNEIINKLLLKGYGLKNSVAVNEFHVGRCIVDFAIFNGESKAFEIKTEYDSDRRLGNQLETYSKLFQKCYIVIPEPMCVNYESSLPENVGIVLMVVNTNSMNLLEYRPAVENDEIDPGILMRSLRTSEYKEIILSYYGSLPDVSCYEIFDKCLELMYNIPGQELQRLFNVQMKKRISVTRKLESYPSEIRQMCLSMNLDGKSVERLLLKLNSPIIPV